MQEFDARVTGYIANAADFAIPVLQHLRALVHRAVPEIKETIKWGHIHFDFKGSVCHMAAFKEHCVFGFWKAKHLPDPEGIFGENANTAMGQLGRITKLSDLPQDEIIMLYVRNAATLNQHGIKVAKPKP